MNRLTLIATAALVIAALVGGAYLLAGHPSGPAIPSPTAAPPTASPKPEGIVAMPDAIWGDWHAEIDTLPGITTTPQPIRLSLAWQDGREAHVQLDGDGLGRMVFQSAPMSASVGELRFRHVGTAECAIGDEGTYRWTRSTDGLFLTLTLVEDACAARAAAFARTWVHSLSAVSDGGLGMVPFDPWIQVALPTGQRYGMAGGTDAPEITTFGGGDPSRAFVVVKNPGGFGDPCSTTDPKKQDIAHTTDALRNYIEGLPDSQVTTTEAVQVGGRPASRIFVQVTASTCTPTGFLAFHPSDLQDSFDWSFEPGEQQHLYLVQYDADTTLLLWYEGSAEEEAAVIGSIQFLDKLPAPPAS